MGFICISLRLCSRKIAWDNYAPLQMISEYFPARGRPLNRVKEPTCQKRGWQTLRTSPIVLKRAVDFNGTVGNNI